jgi:hypothetical protein
MIPAAAGEQYEEHKAVRFSFKYYITLSKSHDVLTFFDRGKYGDKAAPRHRLIVGNMRNRLVLGVMVFQQTYKKRRHQEQAEHEPRHARDGSGDWLGVNGENGRSSPPAIY